MRRERALPAGIRPFDVALAFGVGLFNIAIGLRYPLPPDEVLVPLPPGVHVPFVVVAMGVVLFRRHRPRAVAAAIAVLGLVHPHYFIGVAAYALGAYGRGRVRDWLLVVALVVAPYIGSAYWRAMPTVSDMAAAAAVIVGLALLGFYIGARRRLLAAATERAERAEREQELLAEQARADERLRLAADMHDVVTHRINLMVLQAGALRVDTGEEAVRRAAEDLREAGCQALAELRDLVGVLRSGRAGATETTSPPGGLVALVAESASAGVDARLSERGDPDALSPTVRRTLYRVVQESLTNAGKHAPGSRTTVEVDYDPGQRPQRAARPGPRARRRRPPSRRRWRRAAGPAATGRARRRHPRGRADRRRRVRRHGRAARLRPDGAVWTQTVVVGPLMTAICVQTAGVGEREPAR